jgi:hypothetical protein
MINSEQMRKRIENRVHKLGIGVQKQVGKDFIRLKANLYCEHFEIKKINIKMQDWLYLPIQIK